MKLSSFLRFNLCLLVVTLSSSGRSDHSDASAGAPNHIQEVGVVTLTAQRVAITEELPGRTTALRISDAILIVEFAKENFEKGMNLVEAAKHAAAQRLRPILMTSFAFIMGVMPLAISGGAGSGGQNAIGTGTIGGMLSATVLAIFFVPLFFVATLRW